MTNESAFRLAFAFLLIALLVMRVHFMLKVHRAGERLMPDAQAVKREGGRGMFIVRVVMFFGLIVFLVMYFAGAGWIKTFSCPVSGWLRWTGFVLGFTSVIFWTWTQIHLDTQWSAQLQLTKGHHLVTSGPYARIRHPLYTAMFGWAIAIALLTANWIFTAVCLFSIIGTVVRVSKEEQMMIETFGDEYKAYMQRTGRFFPKL